MQERYSSLTHRTCIPHFRLLAALLSLVIVLAACAAPVQQGAAGGGAAAGEETITLKMMCWDSGVGPTELIEGEVIPGFQASHPNVNVEYEALPWAEYWTKIGALAASGTMPDFYCNSVAYLWDHANKGMSLDLQPMFDQDLNPDDYFMELTAVERYPDADSDLYGFPVRWVDGALFYNKNLFDEAGLAYPDDTWTYDDVLEAAKQLTKDTDGDGEVDQWGIMASMNHVMLDSVIKSNGGQVVNEDYTKCMLTEPKALAAIQWMVDLVQVHGVSPSPSVAQGFAQGIFPSGKVAMAIDGSYQTRSWHEIQDFEWDVAMQPQGSEARVVYGGPDSLSISKSTAHPDLAWDFIKHMLSEEVQSRGDIIGLGSLPILKSAAYSEAWIQAEGQPANAKVFADSGPYVVGADFGSQWIEWRATIMNNELDQALLGQRSVEESAAAACTAIDAVLASIEKPQ